jgi:lysophospholipase L1-like esterase
MKQSTPLAVFALSLLSPFCIGAETPASLPKEGRLAIVGDSITEQKLYSKFIETYLLTAAGRPDVRVFQFGWGGETAGGFDARLKSDLAVFRPDVVTLCYGMNDGTYRPYEDAIGKRYEDSMRSVLTKLKGDKIHVVVGTPGAVDTKYFSKPFAANLNSADSYNDSLAKLGQIGKKLAGEFQGGFADVHSPMVESMAKAKAAYGADYDVCGRDGVHPGANGHLAMAYAFLKGLGCDGNVGEITMDASGKTTASTGHKVLASAAGKAEIESERYPFCFDPDPKSSGSTRSILPHLPFNKDLNRFTLKVANLSASKAKITWGTESREFTKAQLEAGINLAEEFAATPFDKAFATVMNAVAAKQAYETIMIKGMISHFRAFNTEVQNDPELGTLFEKLRQKLGASQARLDAETRTKLVPVKHTLTVTPL